nr:unnamed protein product [Digitaria exilis]
MAPHNSVVCRLCVLLLLLVVSTTTLSSAASSSDPFLCTMPSPAPQHVPAGEDALPILRSLELNAGYFTGGEDIHFTKDEHNATSSYSYVSRFFSLLPLHSDRTSNTTLFHVAATLTLFGGRARDYLGDHSRRRHHYVVVQMVTFHFDGYYNSDSGELCMAGSGSYREDDGSNARLLGVVLHLRVPNPSSIMDPFVTGRLRGKDMETISLVAYAENDDTYKYGSESASCPASSQPSATRRGSNDDDDDFSCAYLKGQLVGSYELQHGTPPPLLDLRLQEPSMHIGQVQCTEEGAVRAYVVFSNDTDTTQLWRRRRMQPIIGRRRPPFVVGDEVVVAEGRWNSVRRMLCLRACRARVVREEMSVVVEKEECGIGMSFWFPGVWTMRDRSAIAGMLWNSSQAKVAPGTNDGSSGVISVSRTTSAYIHRSNFSDVKYVYNDTMVEAAKKHYRDLTSELSSYKKIISGSFVPPNYTNHDLEFQFYDTEHGGHGEAYPVTIGSTIVYGDQLAADDSFSRDVVVDMKKGAISSLRDKATDPLFFEKIDIRLYGMFSGQLAESISRMDLESVMLVISTTLPCVFAILQILHVKRRPEASAATSVTMLVVLAMGHVAPMVPSSEALFMSRRRHYYPFAFQNYLPFELSQAMMRAPTLIALLLQLRLIQLALTARKRDTDRTRAEASSAAERRSLWLCLPLYLIGGALTIIFHAMNARREDSLTVRIGPEPATLWEDLVSSAGLALDAFLLPQIAMNALSAGARVRALSPWFYVGGTVVRAMPHVYEVVRGWGYVPSMRASYVYASPRFDRFGVGWDVVVPCVAAMLAVLVFLQQRVRLVPAPLFPAASPRRRLGDYEMVSNL